MYLIPQTNTHPYYILCTLILSILIRSSFFSFISNAACNPLMNCDFGFGRYWSGLPPTPGIVSHSLRSRHTDLLPHENLGWKYFPWNFSGSAPLPHLGVHSVVPFSRRPPLTTPCLIILLPTPSTSFHPWSCLSFSSLYLLWLCIWCLCFFSPARLKGPLGLSYILT